MRDSEPQADYAAHEPRFVDFTGGSGDARGADEKMPDGT